MNDPQRPLEQPLHRVVILLVSGVLLLSGGCMEQRMVSNTYGPFGEQEEREERERRSSGQDLAGGAWAIALGRVEGEQHRAEAERKRAQLIQATGMKDVWVQDELNRSALYFGQYESPQDEQAQRDMARWQQLMSSGRIKLPVLMLTPVSNVRSGSDVAQFDLRNAASLGQYTLQIGFYDESIEQDPRYKGTSFRTLAEDAAEALREDGKEAFFYHGPVRSMITVGIFHDEDAQVKLDRSGAPTYGPKVEALRKEFPFNAGNGLTMRETLPTGQKRDQPSFLVRIPGAKIQPLRTRRQRQQRPQPGRADDWFLTNPQ